MAENIRTRQDHIEFLESYISEITEKIDSLTEGRDLEKEIESLEYRIQVLEAAGDKFADLIGGLKDSVSELKEKYELIKPTIDELIAERAYYRTVQHGLV